MALLINRKGEVAYVVVGTYHRVVFPSLDRYRTGDIRLLGLRCVHTHLADEPLSQDDLMDLAFLGLDLMAAIATNKSAVPICIYAAHLIPAENEANAWEHLDPIMLPELDIDCLGLIHSLEAQFAQSDSAHNVKKGRERALLVNVSTESRTNAEVSIAELKELTESCDVDVAGCVIQQRHEIDPRFVIGRGKLSEIVILALQKRAALLIFDRELNPSQIRSITDVTELKVVDRTQLILDIFARRAQSREGKIQVELAQLKYLLPRLVGKGTAMSRLTGGIGARGPGETKLEVDRRRVRDRIVQLEKMLITIQQERMQRRAKRNKRRLPVVSIVGYTNAGKSTLLNTLTRSSVCAENRLFVTLDPTSRRKRLPKETEIIITDTVGFIRELPKELVTAFRSTLEELSDADLLVHVVDISNPDFLNQIESVERILESLDLHGIPMIRVLNKTDLVSQESVTTLAKRLNGIPVCAKKPDTLETFLGVMESRLAEAVRRCRQANP